MLGLIASGQTSQVFRCANHSTSRTYDETVVGVKLMRDKPKAFEEISKILAVGHPNIISILDIVEAGAFVGIVMPLIHMDLRVFMHGVAYYPSTSLQIMRQITRAVHHIHTRGIIHLDIKPENICINVDKRLDFDCGSDGFDVHCKLLDFGSSLSLHELHVRGDTPSEPSKTASPIVVQTTRGYQPPELLSVNGILSSAGDVYSSGVVFGEIMEFERRDTLTGVAETEDAHHDLIRLLDLSLDMTHRDFKQRPSSRDVLIRLMDHKIEQPLLKKYSSTPIWECVITNVLRGGVSSQTVCISDILINDQSTDLQKLVTLVCSGDAHIVRDAFWLLYETSVEEEETGRLPRHGMSVLSILSYFESRVHLSKENGLFYAKSLDILSLTPQFTLSDDARFHLWRISSSSCACERPVLRCLSNCWSGDESLREWCIEGSRRWGKHQDSFCAFASRFVDDWDSGCVEAVQRMHFCDTNKID